MIAPHWSKPNLGRALTDKERAHVNMEMAKVVKEIAQRMNQHHPSDPMAGLPELQAAFNRHRQNNPDFEWEEYETRRRRFRQPVSVTDRMGR